MSENNGISKGAGTTFWRLKSGVDASTLTKETYLSDEKWDLLAKIKELTPGEITVADEEDDYLDDENADWSRTAPGQKSVGDVSFVLAWNPGDTAQQKLVDDVDKDVITVYRAKYPNNTVDAWNAYINSLGKTVTSKDKITRSVKLKPVGKPVIAETLLTDATSSSS